MKTKTDLYTKIVLTVIAVALTGNLIKDIDFVSKAHAGEADLSAVKMEKAESVVEDGEITYYIYENARLNSGFGTTKYVEKRYSTLSPSMRIKDITQAYIEKDYDLPKYIITTKKGSFWLEK